MPKGAFISFEGGDGTGKSTQIQLLTNQLKKLGYDVVVSREPGGTPFGEELRTMLKTKSMSALAELFIFEASRAEHVEKLIRPSLQKGKVVISDRYADSSLVYQGVGRGLGVGFVRKINEIATQKLKADMVVFLDTRDHDIFRARRGARKLKDRFERERASFHEKVEKAFRSLAAKDRRFKTFEANQSIESLHSAILKEVLRKLKVLKVNRKSV